jgi:hypothetical protein
MSQLNGDAIEKIQELTLAAVHTQELKTTMPYGYVAVLGTVSKAWSALTSPFPLPWCPGNNQHCRFRSLFSWLCRN